MREYESIYTGSNSDNLVSEEKLAKARTVQCAEWEHCGKSNVEYVLAYDVARDEGAENAQSALVVIKLTPKSNGFYKRTYNCSKWWKSTDNKYKYKLSR